MTHYCKNGDEIKVGGVYVGGEDGITSCIAIDEPAPHGDNYVVRCNESHPKYGKQWQRPENLERELSRDQDGYYLWDGGECPVPGEWVIKAEYPMMGSSGPAGDCKWKYVRRFRVVSTGEEVKPTSKLGWETVPEVPYDGGGKLMFENCTVNNDNAEGVIMESKPKLSQYQRNIKGVVLDVYDFLIAYGVTCPARQHAIKKLLMAGQRGAKDEHQDLGEARDSIVRSIELLLEPAPTTEKCDYPDCNCPFDMGADNKCLRGLCTDHLRKGVR